MKFILTILLVFSFCLAKAQNDTEKVILIYFDTTATSQIRWMKGYSVTEYKDSLVTYLDKIDYKMKTEMRLFIRVIDLLGWDKKSLYGSNRYVFLNYLKLN